MKLADISELEQELTHAFRNRGLLEQALTHSSLARERESQNGQESAPDNEQLEFLGDAVLSLITSQTLFERYPQFGEGQLSKLRAHLVSEKHLIRAAQRLQLGRFLRLGRGEEKSGGREKTALLVDALEAVLAALYLDAGFEKTRQFIVAIILDPELKRLKKTMAQGLPITDFKSALQEAVHTAARPQPSYVLIQEEGPDHQRRFTVEARIGRLEGGKFEFVGRGKGSTKKAAEQDAAKKALKYLWALAERAETAASSRPPQGSTSKSY